MSLSDNRKTFIEQGSAIASDPRKDDFFDRPDDIHLLYVACETTREIQELDTLMLRARLGWRCDDCKLVNREHHATCELCGKARV